jgi:mRNA-degrading endonuclease RelE of RelBE toxin-antitoxin system
MSYQAVTVPASRRALNKLPRPIRKQLVREVQKLEENPRLGARLMAPWQNFYSLHTKLNNTHYRIIYEIDKRNRQVIIRYAASRENFYQELRRLKLKPLSRG